MVPDSRSIRLLFVNDLLGLGIKTVRGDIGRVGIVRTIRPLIGDGEKVDLVDTEFVLVLPVLHRGVETLSYLVHECSFVFHLVSFIGYEPSYCPSVRVVGLRKLLIVVYSEVYHIDLERGLLLYPASWTLAYNP